MNKHEFTIGQKYKDKQGRTLEVITVYTDSEAGYPLIMKDTESDKHWSFKLNGTYSTEASNYDLVLVPINQATNAINAINTTDTFVTFSGESITFRSAGKASDTFYEFLGTNNMSYSLSGKVFDDARQNDCDIDFSITNEINKDYTYYTKSGKRVTFETYSSPDPFYDFVGSNTYFYSKQGTIFKDEENYSNHDMDIDFTKTPILTSALTSKKETHMTPEISHQMDNTIHTFDNIWFDECPEDIPEVTNTIKRKSKVDGIKRKIKIDRLSDDTIQVTIKTAYPELDKPLVTRFALSYEALDLFEEAIDALHEELEDEAEGFCCGDCCSDCQDCQG